MRFRPTGVLAVLFAGLLAFVYFYEIKGGGERARSKIESRRILSVDPDSVSQISIHWGDTPVVAARQGDLWRISKPIETAGYAGSIQPVALALEEFEQEGVAVEGGALASGRSQLSDFGLDPADLSVRVTHSGRNDTLWFGDKSPTGQYIYFLRSGSPDVLLAAAARRSNFEKTLFDLREKLVMTLDTDAVTRIRIEADSPGQAVEAELQDGIWMLTHPLEDRADDAEVGRLLSRLRSVRAQSFESEVALDLGRFGLESPRLRITATEGDVQKSLLIGNRARLAPVPRYYARAESAPVVVTLDSALVSNLNKPASVLRNKDVFTFTTPADSIDRLSLVYGDSLVSALRPDDAADWVLEGRPGTRAIGTSVNRLIQALKGLKATGFASESTSGLSRFGLTRPKVTVVLEASGGVVRRIQFGVNGGKAFALREGRPQVYEISPGFLDRLDLDTIDYGSENEVGSTFPDGT